MMDPPKHDRLKALFQRGFTPKRIAEHEGEIRAIAERVLDGLDGERRQAGLRLFGSMRTLLTS